MLKGWKLFSLNAYSCHSWHFPSRLIHKSKTTKFDYWFLQTNIYMLKGLLSKISQLYSARIGNQILKHFSVSDVLRLFGRLIYWLGLQNFGAQETLFKFPFSAVFNKKYVEVAINDFTMHLIISKWLRRQICRLKRKTIRQKEVEPKETVYESAFINLNTL